MNQIADPAKHFFNDLSPSEAQKWVDALDVTYCMRREPVISSDDWRRVPAVALLCKQDSILPSDLLQPIWQGTHIEWIDAAHTPYVSQPENVSEITLKIVHGRFKAGSVACSA